MENNTKRLKCILTTLGLSLMVVLSYNGGVNSSIAQQQGGTK